MRFLSVALAALFAATPDDDDATLRRYFADCNTPAMRRRVQRAAVEHGLIDRREADEAHVLGEADWFFADLSNVRRRGRELQSAPPIEDHERFPSREAANSALTANHNYRQQLLLLRSLHWNRRYIEALLEDTAARVEVWDAVRDAQSGFYYTSARRFALQRLRRAVGDRAYYSGELPEPTPRVILWGDH